VGEGQGRWYRRFAEVPGVGYEGDLRLHETLPARNATPEVSRYELGGHGRVYLTWPDAGGGTSSSPVHQLAFAEHAGESSEKTRERVLTALELPGQVSDYHFAIQGAAEALWKRRREDPAQISFVEWLCWWDVRLVEAHPDFLRVGADHDQFMHVAAFDRIVNLYLREGFLREALAAAERFAPFRPSVDTVSDLRSRVARLREEHG